RGRVRDDVRPFPQQRLNESLGFAVGARRIGARATVPKAESLTAVTKGPRHIATAVVAQDPPHGDAARAEPRDGAREERRTRRPELVCQDLDVGDPAVIVDRDMHVLPADPRTGAPAITMDPMPDTANPTQWLDVDVNHVPGRRPLIALNRHGRGRGPALEPESAEPGADGRARNAQRPANRPRRQAIMLAQPLNQGPRPGRRLGPRRTGPRAAILEAGDAGLPKPTYPFRHGADTHARALGRLGIRPVLKEDAADQQQPGRGRTLRITMELHPGPPLV